MTVYRGWQGTIQVNGTNVAEAEGWSVDVDDSTEAHFVVGNRTATDITVGPKNVTGSFNRIWVDDTYSDLSAQPNDKPASFTFYGQAGSGLAITCNDCIWSTWGGAGESDGYATESLDFICKGIKT